MIDLSSNKLVLGSGVLTATGQNLYLNGALVNGTPALYSKSLSIDMPVSGDSITLFKTDQAITVNKMWAVLRGDAPTTTYNVKFGTGRADAGIEIVTNGVAINSTTSGILTNSFNNSYISGNCWVWLDITATGGNSLSGFHNTLFYTYS